MLPPQIEGFVEVARAGTLRAAAARLHITQPALTSRIQSLEAELGTPLFRRRHSGMELNHAGRAFLPYAERAIASLEGGAALVADLTSGATGELVIGAAPAVGSYVLPILLERFQADHPDIRLIVRSGHSEELLEMVVRREVEMALIRELHDPRLHSRPLFEDQLVLTVAPDHPFAGQRGVDVSAIREEPLILFDRASSYFELTQALFRAAGVEPRGMVEVDSIETAKRMVLRRMGVALLPGTAVADAIAAGELQAAELLGAGRIRRRIVAVEAVGGLEDSPAMEGFSALLDRIPELIPGARPVTRQSRRSR
jgi:DNA-binding transcriptional LysR family regulator